MPQRHNRIDPSDPAALAARLPDELRSFDSWHYTDNGDPTGLRDYLAAVSDHLGDYADLTMPVMNAAGLSAADWYRRMLTDTT
jgi:uncharacterized protein (DUF2267 family)